MERGNWLIKYHGLPITPATAAIQAVNGGHALVSFRHQQQLGIAVDYCQSFCVDNGAFSAWKSGKPIEDWSPYYSWVEDVMKYPGFDFAIIPDIIEGSEEDNRALIEQWPFSRNIGAPVWHMYESLYHLSWLVNNFPRVCIGSSGEYRQVGSKLWWERIAQAMIICCDKDGRTKTKLHGLRMLSPKIYTKIPLASADSCNIAMNIGIDKAWKGTYTPPTKEARAQVMRARIEAFNSPPAFDFDDSTVAVVKQQSLFDFF